jgi:ketosteroid isomerase-like protein
MMTTQAESEESLVEELVAAEADAWNKGDAHAFSTRCTEDISFMNIIGTSYYGRAAFEERSIKRLCFIRADVATADVNTELRSYAKLPSGIQTGDDGVLRTRLLLVLAKEHEGSPRFTSPETRHWNGFELGSSFLCSIWNRRSH